MFISVVWASSCVRVRVYGVLERARWYCGYNLTSGATETCHLIKFTGALLRFVSRLPPRATVVSPSSLLHLLHAWIYAHIWDGGGGVLSRWVAALPLICLSAVAVFLYLAAIWLSPPDHYRRRGAARRPDTPDALRCAPAIWPTSAAGEAERVLPPSTVTALRPLRARRASFLFINGLFIILGVLSAHQKLRVIFILKPRTQIPFHHVLFTACITQRSSKEEINTWMCAT